jgi:hypothetical protein
MVRAIDWGLYSWLWWRWERELVGEPFYSDPIPIIIHLVSRVPCSALAGRVKIIYNVLTSQMHSTCCFAISPSTCCHSTLVCSQNMLHPLLLTFFVAGGGGDDPHRQPYVPLLVN